MRVQVALLAAIGVLASPAVAAIKGFNSGATLTTGAPKSSDDFAAEFNTAKGLQGTNGEFTSFRLYTCIQAGTSNSPSAAFQAAVDTGTHLLLGLWASAGADIINNEIAALTAGISAHGTKLTDLIDGISVGSEDLYRITPTGIANKAGIGADPATIVGYINQVKSAVANTDAKGKLVGHVDTWTGWVNGSNADVVTASDFLGMDAYPYFQTTVDNSIGNSNATFYSALDATIAVSQGKPVWVTETGWPVSGNTLAAAVPSVQNALTYWDAVACSLFASNTNTWWYTLQDARPDTPNPSFGVTTGLSETPIYNLAC